MIYEYQCENCGTKIEQFRSCDERDAPVECSFCGGICKRIISLFEANWADLKCWRLFGHKAQMKIRFYCYRCNKYYTEAIRDNKRLKGFENRVRCQECGEILEIREFHMNGIVKKVIDD